MKDANGNPHWKSIAHAERHFMMHQGRHQPETDEQVKACCTVNGQFVLSLYWLHPRPTSHRRCTPAGHAIGLG